MVAIFLVRASHAPFMDPGRMLGSGVGLCAGAHGSSSQTLEPLAFMEGSVPVGPAWLASGAEAPGSRNHLPAADSCLLCQLGGGGGGGTAGQVPREVRQEQVWSVRPSTLLRGRSCGHTAPT